MTIDLDKRLAQTGRLLDEIAVLNKRHFLGPRAIVRLSSFLLEVANSDLDVNRALLTLAADGEKKKEEKE